MTDDDPLDLDAVAADDAAVEQLRSRSVVSDDVALLLLRDLVADVETDLPQDAPVGRGSTVLQLAGEQPPERRNARRGTVVVALAAGLVALGGAAAAGTLAPEGSPLHGLGQLVRDAGGAVVDAVTPPETTTGRSAGGTAGAAAVLPSPTPARVGPPAVRPSAAPTAGASVSAAARSQAAARQVAALLDQAERLLADRRVQAATARLDSAERRLADVLPLQAAPLRARLTELRSRAAAAEEQGKRPVPGTRPGPARPEPGPPAPKSRKAPARAGSLAPGDKAVVPRVDLHVRRNRLAQLSMDASAKPRA